MATLQDVRAFARQHSDLSLEELQNKIAAEFNMTRDEAAQLMTGLGSEDPSLAQRDVSPLDVAVVAGGLAGTGGLGTNQNTPGLTVLAAEAALEDEQDALGRKPGGLDREMPASEGNSETSR